MYSYTFRRQACVCLSTIKPPSFQFLSFVFSDRDSIERTIARNDKDGDGGISFEEFVEMNIKTRVKVSNNTSHARVTCLRYIRSRNYKENIIC